MLNSLIGSNDLRKSVETIWNRDPSAFQVLGILIAVRKRDKKMIIDAKGQCVTIYSKFETVDGVLEFLENTGLAGLFKEKKIKDLVDYVFGVETGLDSNSRKNRSGHAMENTVAKIFAANDIHFSKEMDSVRWSKLQHVLGEDKKRFDFVIETNRKTYLIEVNFYNNNGSKLNETARSYSDIAPKINSVYGFEFVWITDGKGWLSAKNKLKEAYSIIPSVYNLTSIQEFIELVKSEE